MLYSTKGIVLRLVQYKDNSYIAEIYTQRFGKISFSVHRPQSKKATIRNYHLMPFSLLDMQIEYKENRDIQKIREASLASECYTVVDSPVKGLICQFMAEVVSKTLESNNADDQLFDYFTSLVSTISISEGLGTFPLDFLLVYAQYLGIYPDDGESNEFIRMISAEEKLLMLQALEDTSALSRMQRRKTISVLLKYYQYFLPSMGAIKSLDVITDILG